MFTDQNMTLLTDLYQLTMMQGYYKYGKKDKTAVFDLFFRENPFHAAFSVTAISGGGSGACKGAHH